jgi:hypothetical protein
MKAGGEAFRSHAFGSCWRDSNFGGAEVRPIPDRRIAAIVLSGEAAQDCRADQKA